MAADSSVGAARLWRSAKAGIWAHAPIILVLALGYLATLLLLDGDDHQVPFDLGTSAQKILGLFPAFLATMTAAGLIGLLMISNRVRMLSVAARWLRSGDWIEILTLRLPIVVLLTFLSHYVLLYFKVNIANLNPYAWDHAFAAADRLLFGGYDPWRLSHRLFGTPEMTKLIDNLYLVWFFVQHFCVLFAALLPMRSELRLTFLLAYYMNWMLGGVAISILLPAVGPVYMEAVTGDATFRPLMDLLHQQSLSIEIKALTIQKDLWLGFTDPSVDPLGISAFPSMHVQMAVVFALFGFALHRALGWILTLFAAITLIGSVHLGWHYAVDGIAGAIFAVILWYASRLTIRWWLARTEPALVAGRAQAEPPWADSPVPVTVPSLSGALADQATPEFAKNRFSTSR